jgi:ParB family transcriptional regulator, chromosome partitioning protein
MQVPLNSIYIGKRVRKDLGDVTDLIDSMRRVGQMNPVILSEDYELIAGHRRAEAARRLGWTSVEALVLRRTSEVDRLEMEIEENTRRKELTIMEIEEGYERLRRLRNPGFLMRLAIFFRNLFRKLFRRRRHL